MSDYLTAKEVGRELKRGRTYTGTLKAAMVASGYPWPGGRITMVEVVAWLNDNPDFRSTWPKRKPSEQKRAFSV